MNKHSIEEKALLNKFKYVLRIMKITLFLLFFGLLFTSAANSYSQEFTFNLNATSIREVCKEIEKNSDFIFVFSDNSEKIIDKKLNVNANAKNISEVLNTMFVNTGLVYKILDKQIVVYELKESAVRNAGQTLFGNTQQSDQPIVFKGRVIDTKGEPLVGVTIRMKGFEGGYITDQDGYFEIITTKDEVYLTFTYVGFKPQEVTAKKGQTLTITMEENIAEIGEVVVTGFVTKSKNSYTGSQTTVTREQLTSVGTKNVLESIQAFVPGMQIVDNNNMGSNPNTRPEINIRGRASFEGAANVPIFVVDGSQVSLDYIYDMDMNDVENVTVLKDASASALYGAKASAGVIVITTKALTGGKLKFNYSGTIRTSMPDLSGYRLLDAAQKLEYERLAGVYTDNIVGGADQYRLDEQYAQRFQTVRSGVNTDWLSMPLRNGISQNHNISIDGGDENARYNVGLRYGKDDGVMKGSDRERLSSFFKLSYNKEHVFYISNTSTISIIKSNESPYGSFYTYGNMNPYDRPYDNNGDLLKRLSHNMDNPIYEASIGNYDRSEQFYIMNNTDLRVHISPELRLDGAFSFMKQKDDNRTFESPLSKRQLDIKDPSLRGQLEEQNSKSIKYSGKLMLSYNRYLTDKLYLSSMGGANIDASNKDNAVYRSIGFYSDKLAHPAFATRYPASESPAGSDLIDRSIGFFVNANAIYNNKYFLDFIYRYEGSSKFGKDKRFAPFWSAGAGWNVHNEPFMKDVNAQTLKLRASVGYLGNAGFSPYQAMTTYMYGADYNYIKGIGTVPITIGNPLLKWERTLNTNVGIDLTLFNNRWDLVLDAYVKNTDNLLLDVTKAPSVGVSLARENIGAIENRGIEFQTRVVPVTNKEWHWALSLNYSYNSNKIKSISDALRNKNEANMNAENVIAPLPIYEEGESLTVLKVVPSAGIDPATGKEIYIKRDGSYTFDYDAHDRVTFGDTAPFAFGTFGSYLTYKQFSVNMMFGYSLGGLVYNQTLATRVEGSNPIYNADTRVFNDRWKQAGDHAKYKDIADMTIPKQTSRFVAVNNYLDLRTLSFAYDFNAEQLKILKVRRLRLEAMINDLFHLSSVKRERGLDYPFSRSVELSLRVSF
ncbi:MAG: SusC/RagA family TonB-linked outer membrane protein [Bacteroidia bacterium]|nr:SusC/RagA family TonB-linked outer membrane protein [Bacteroidia bacterium]